MLEPLLFRFAIISDTHIRPLDESSSPWKTNLMTNDRARWIAWKIEQYYPDFIIHLGDIVHPVPHLPSYASASSVANQILNEIRAPIYYVPGNHDIGDKDNPTVPAYIVNNSYIQTFKKYYGPTYQSFDHNRIHFVLINSPVLNSKLREEKQQKQWLKEDLMLNTGKRTFVFSHYPPYIYLPDEQNNYDNIDKPERYWFLDLLRQYNVEALFAGHVHQFGYKKYYNTHIYNLFSTCFVRQDFSEMFRVEPADEYGRNDSPKLGYCIVDIYVKEHKVHIYRSNGATLNQNNEPSTRKWNKLSDTTNLLLTPLGVHIRHPLNETIELPYMGPIDEFVRKRINNDYPILGLWETGIKTVRLPLDDVLNDETSKRLNELHDYGHRFGFFTVGIPDTSLISRNRELIGFLEVILPWETAKLKLPEISKLRERTDTPVYVANIESSVHRERIGSKFSHYISYGFHVNEFAKVEEILRNKGLIDGFVFQIAPEDHPIECIKNISEFSKNKGFKTIINVRLGSDDPAQFMDDDDRVAYKATMSIIAAYAYPDVKVLLDTFIDHDRGYFPRIGLYDRRNNPRKSAHILRNLNNTLQYYGANVLAKTIQFNEKNLTFSTEKLTYRLHFAIDAMETTLLNGLTTIDLISGEIIPETIKDWSLEIIENIVN